MAIEINGQPFKSWLYTIPGDAELQYLPTDGSARLRSGPRRLVEHLKRTGKLIINVVDSSQYEPCDLPILGLSFAV